MKNPLIVHCGLLYIKEDCGPIKDLLCAINIEPARMSIAPTTISIFIICLFFISLIFAWLIHLFVSSNSTSLISCYSDEN